MRQRKSFNDYWRFHKGEITIERPITKPPMYTQAKTERYRMGPASIHYPDTSDAYNGSTYPHEHWEYVRLPHDYVVWGTPTKSENEALGYLKYENAWYRKHFEVPETDAGKRIIIEFEGVAGNSTVYLNGCLLKHNFSTYTSYTVDITDYVVCGGENVLAVHLDLSDFEGWWYEGAGIYRNVWMTVTDEISVDTDGVYINPQKVDDTKWNALLETTLFSVAAKEESVSLVTEIIDRDGNTVARATAETAVSSHGAKAVKYQTEVTSPHLWDIDDPYLYQVKTTVFRGGEACDEYITRTGFRYYTCDPERGLFLNGRHVKIKGVCCHEDCGLLGKAIPKNVHDYRIRLLKEMGANGYRTAHYQQSTDILDALDEQGFIVLNEARWFASSDEGIAQVETLVRRDRNRPSVFFWSLSNEEHHHLTEQGRRITQTLMRAVRRLDGVRPITSAVDKSPNVATVFDELDSVGINYNLELFEEVHAKYPEKSIFSSENAATATSRAWYYPDSNELARASAYDKDTNAWFRGREYTWKFIDSHPWIMGGYQWTGLEYRGESTVWPRQCSISGAIDLFLQKKDAFYQNRSHWSETPNIHILPHWNVETYDGEPVRVWAYTNCEEAELFLNGRSLGRKTVEKHTHLEWMVDYEPGKIEAVGYIGGKQVANEVHETAGEPYALVLRLENEVKTVNDVAIITCYTVDKEGRFVPTATPTVTFHANSIGRIISTGSDNNDITPLGSPTRKMYAGYISVAAGIMTYRGGPYKGGTIEVYAHADGLKSAKLRFDLT